MWKLWHRLFGFDYIYWHNSAADGIARVWRTKCGNVVYWRYKNTKVLDEIKRHQDVKWLTCVPTKYLGEERGIVTIGEP